jgi:CRP-like cAMP-binding protein
MIEAHLAKLRARDEISLEEENAVRALPSEVIEVPPDRTLIRRGQELENSMLLLSGWMARVKDLPTGERQIVELQVAGDFTDLHGFTLKRLDHDVISLSKCRVALVPHKRLKALTENFPHLTRMYWLLTNIDAAIHREWAALLGRSSAIVRMAYLFCEMNLRLSVSGLSNGNSYELPLTQAELGECLGLTSVHVNRTLQELRRSGLVELERQRLDIIDLEKLKAIAGFDPGYLYFDKRPR